MDSDLREGLHGGQVRPEDENDNVDSENDSVGDEDMEEDIDPDIRDDILKPASTRSKIVVNLREMKDETTGKKRPFKSSDPIIYDLDPYDKVRMRLLKEDEALYKAYLQTKKDIETNLKFQPKKLKIGWCQWFWIGLI